MSFSMGRHQAGFSLVELMIAVVLGLIISTVVIEIFISNNAMYRSQDAWSRMQENGRFAIKRIANSIQETGYMGCLPSDDLDKINNTINGFANNYQLDFANAGAIDGADGQAGGGWLPALDGSLAQPLTGTDLITVRGASMSPSNVLADNGNSLQVTNQNEFEQNDFAIVMTCTNAAIFQITNDPANGLLEHNAPENSTASLGVGSNYADAEVYPISTTSYYIANDGNQIPTLYSSTGGAAGQPLVSYVEDMQLEYGVDTNGDSSIDAYVVASGVVDWTEVISVKINLLLVSEEDNLTVDGGSHNVFFYNQNFAANDQRLRAAFTQTVSLRNRIP